MFVRVLNKLLPQDLYFCNFLLLHFMINFNPIQRMGIFVAAPLLKISQISYNDETWHSYTLPKEDPQIHESPDTSLELC